MTDQSFHVRSISLPSRSHPVAIQIEEDLQKIRACAASSTAEAVCDGLRGLRDAYDSVKELLRLPHNHQFLSHPNQMEEELDLSLRLLDLSGAVRDGLAATREHLQELHHSLRRKDCHHDSTPLRSIKKTVASSSRSLLKQNQRCRKRTSCSAVDAVLVETREISISLLKSTASFMTAPRSKVKASRWSFVCKALRVGCEEHEHDNREESVAALCSSIRELEAGVESLYRRLIQNRISLLNILSF